MPSWYNTSSNTNRLSKKNTNDFQNQGTFQTLETKNWGIETENEIQKFSRLKGAGAYLTKT